MCSVLLIVWYCIFLFERLKVFYLLMQRKFSKNPAKSMLAAIACLFKCVSIAHVLWIDLSRKKKSKKVKHCV